MKNKLFTKEVDKLLFKQFPLGSDLDNQVVVAKIFNPYGRGTWYVINSDPDDPDYLWCIVNFYELEMGSVSRKELEDIRINVYGHKFPLERDLGFSPVNAAKLFSDILSGAAYYAKGGETKKNSLNANFNKGSELSSFDDSGKMYSASSRFRPYEIVVFEKPIVGPNGNKLISYQWSYEWTMMPNHEGELVSKRISDWTQAEQSAETGRDIVHKFNVLRTDGVSVSVSSETVPSLLGYTDSKQTSNLPSIVSSVKTLAKQRMQLAILKAQESEYKKIQAEVRALPKPNIIPAEISDLSKMVQHLLLKDKTFLDHVKYWKTDGETKIVYRQENTSNVPDRITKEQLMLMWEDSEIEKRGGKKPKGIYDLERRIERQEKKVKQITDSNIDIDSYANGGRLSYKDGNFYQEQTIELDDTRYTIKIKRGKSRGFDAYTTISLTFDDYLSGNAPKTRTIEFIPDELMPEMVFAATELLEVATQSSSSKNIKKIFSKKIESKLMINGHKELYTIDYSFKHDNKRGAIALYRQKESDSSFDSSFDLSNALPFMPIDVIEAVAQMFQNVQDFILEGSPGN